MWKLRRTSAKSILEKQWEIHFFTFVNSDRNNPKQKFKIVFIYLFMRKLISEMILDPAKCPNHEMYESESAGALLEVKTNF